MVRSNWCVVLLAAVLVLTPATAVFAQAPSTAPATTEEMVPNPQYTTWAKHAPGTSVVMKNDMTMSEMNMVMTMTMTQTLKEVTPEKATIDSSSKIDMGGMANETKQSAVVQPMVAKGNEQLPQGMTGTTTPLPNETLTIDGKTYDCKVYQFSGQSPQGKASGKIWRNDDIPGGIAKLDMKIEGQAAMDIKANVTSVSIK